MTQPSLFIQLCNLEFLVLPRTFQHVDRRVWGLISQHCDQWWLILFLKTHLWCMNIKLSPSYREISKMSAMFCCFVIKITTTAWVYCMSLCARCLIKSCSQSWLQISWYDCEECQITYRERRLFITSGHPSDLFMQAGLQKNTSTTTKYKCQSNMQVALAAFVDLLHSPATDSGDHWEWLEKCSVVIWINDKKLISFLFSISLFKNAALARVFRSFPVMAWFLTLCCSVSAVGRRFLTFLFSPIVRFQLRRPITFVGFMLIFL